MSKLKSQNSNPWYRVTEGIKISKIDYRDTKEHGADEYITFWNFYSDQDDRVLSGRCGNRCRGVRGLARDDP